MTRRAFRFVGALTTAAALVWASPAAWAQPTAAPPAALSAAVAGDTLTLRWLPPLTLPATYVVEAGSAPGRTDIGSAVVAGTTTSLTVPGVPGGNYFLRVRAGGARAASNEVIATVGAACPLPAAPTGLTATVAGQTLSLQWTSAGGQAQLEAGSVPGASNVVDTDLGPVSVVSGTVPPGAWYLRVRERNACGFGPPTADVLATAGVPTPPRNLRSSVIGNVVTFRWDAPIDGTPSAYVLEVGSAPGLSDLTNAPIAGPR